MTRVARRWLVAALSALFAVWIVAPATTPIYDGLQNPDEPYRYVNPPPGAKTDKKPTTGQTVLSVRNGVNGAGFANSGEQGPQISVYIPATSLQVPPGATGVTVTAEPLAPTPPLPKNGTIVTNVYRISATANGADVPIVGTGNAEPSVQMRAPSAKQPGPVFEHRTTSGWQRMKTLRVGNDIYQASVPSFGDWALVQLGAQAGSSSSGGGGINMGLLIGGIAILLVAGVILAIRMRRTSSVPEPRTR